MHILDEMGWSPFNTTSVKDKDGKKHTAYAIEKYWQNLHGIEPASCEEVEKAIKGAFKNVRFIKTYCQYAPEITHTWVAAW